MSSRDRIFARLRQAALPAASSCPPVVAEAEVFADLPAPDDLAAAFARNLAELQGEGHFVPDLAAAAELVGRLLAEAGPGPALRQTAPLLDELLALLAPSWRERLAPPELISGSATELGACCAGITTASALVARTGSVVVTSHLDGGRRLSVLPPLHIVVAPRSALVRSLAEALPRAEGDWSSLCVISGPARTADIEKILVLGAHGPKRLVVIVVG